jgi:hypothetical protein
VRLRRTNYITFFLTLLLPNPHNNLSNKYI